MLKNKLPLCCALLAAFALTATAQQNQPPPAPPAATAAAPATASAPASAAAPAAKDNQPRGYIAVMRVTGEAYVFQAGDTLRFALRAGSLVNAGQQIATGPKANVMLAFSNGATVTIGENAVIAVDEFTQAPFSEMFKMAETTKEPSISKTRLNLVRGEVLANVKKLNTNEGSFFEVKTPIGIAGIRGTTFEISYFPPAPKKEQGAAAPGGQGGAWGAAPTGNTTPIFGLVMLEGTIEMRVTGKTQPIVVPAGQELVLDDATPDALAANTASFAPAVSPAPAQALVLQQAQTMLAAASVITMPSSSALSGMTTAMPADMLAPAPATKAGSNDANGSQPANAAPNSESGPQREIPAADDARFPAPDAQTPAPRLSPTDGAGGQ